MIRFVLRRLVSHLVLWVVASSCAYLLAASALNPRGNYAEQQPPPPDAVIEASLSEYNLNDRDPLARRYAVWVSGVVRGDLGHTWDGESVNAEMGRRVGVSLRLLTLGFATGVVAGVLLAVWAASRQYGWVDRLSAVGALVVVSIPAVVIAVSLENAAVWANTALGVELFRFTGEFTPGLEGGPGMALLDRAQHMLLPTLTVALPMMAVFTRYQRNLMLDTVHADFVRTARAKGLTRRAALVRHALRVALIPLVTYVSFTFAMLFTGAVFAEAVFGWHGVGSFLIASVDRGDVNAVAAVSCFTALCVVVVASVADIAHAALDPRVQLK